MGFLNKLIKSLFKSSNQPEKQTETHQQKTERTTVNTQQPTAQNRSNYAKQPDSSRAELAANLREIFATEYPQYTVHENVDIKMLDASREFGGPIDFVLSLDGFARGAVMIVDKGKKRTKRVYGVELACANTGIGYANFYTHFNNQYFPYSRELAVAYLRKQIH